MRSLILSTLLLSTVVSSVAMAETFEAQAQRLNATTAPVAASATSVPFGSASAPVTRSSGGPIAIPLAPVLDPNYQAKMQQEQQSKATVTYVTVPAAAPAGWQLAEVLKNQPMAASFQQAVERVGLNEPINNNDGFTAFIPVTQGRNSSDVMRSDPMQNATRESLSKYIVKDRINIALIHSTGQKFKAIDGSEVRITKMGDSVRVNDLRVIDSVKTPQGFIYYVKGQFEEPNEARTNVPHTNG